tara:strand:- start:478 stop:936 length:459 start_codon:yes stop_codon:yes gene_type:complete
MTYLSVKNRLLQHCHEQVNKRYSNIKQTISGIEEAMFQESKSSSGDKHNTGRAMLQIDRENAGKQLREIEKLTLLLKKIDINNPSNYARLGSLVFTDKYNYFISISVGKVTVDSEDFLCVSLNSPVGKLLSAKKKGEEFYLNGSTFKITEVC